MNLHTGDYILIATTIVLILLPSTVPALGNALGRFVDRLRGRTPES